MAATPAMAIPKVELHLHLDCGPSYAAVAALAPGTTLAEHRARHMFVSRCTDLADFLGRTRANVELMQDERGLRIVVDDLFDQLQRDGVAYAEVRFAPLLHTTGGLDPRRVVEIVEAATVAASAATGVGARLILCALRHFSPVESMATARLAAEMAGSAVVGFDLAGDEAGFGLDAHEAAFRYAAEEGVALTAHAGEACGPASVWDTLRRLGPSRIGHGVRSIEDDGLVAHLRDTGIHLEVCPTSNVVTNVVDDLAAHPVDRLLRAGVPLGISTDMRGTGVSLAVEHELLSATFGWTDDDLRTVTRAAIDASFAPDELKTDLRLRLDGATT
ncbi:MAG: adenosine deaminase [Actinomycetota bacterium]|nr:adenosine deaminase [Actinomycetota bacterium]